MNCPTCGAPVRVYSGGEGTNSYERLEPERIAKLEAKVAEQQAEIEKWKAELLHEQEYSEGKKAEIELHKELFYSLSNTVGMGEGEDIRNVVEKAIEKIEHIAILNSDRVMLQNKCERLQKLCDERGKRMIKMYEFMSSWLDGIDVDVTIWHRFIEIDAEPNDWFDENGEPK